MRKSLLFFSAVAATVMSLAGCQKELGGPLSTHTVTFVADQDDSKTVVSEENGKAVFAWTEADKANFQVFENGNAATSTDVNIDGGIATITATFEDIPAAEYKYTGFVSGTTALEGVYPAVSTLQTVRDNMYDSSADILVAEPQTCATVAENIIFRYKRTVSVSRMTIKNIPAGEIVEKVTVSADKAIAGYFDTDNDVWVTASGDIDVIVNKTVPEGDSLVVGIVMAPVEDATFTVKLSTDKKHFRKIFPRTLSLVEGSLTAYKVNMDGCHTYINVSPVDTAVAATAKKSEINISSNASWTAVSTKGNTITPSSGNGDCQVVLSFAENTSSADYRDTVTIAAVDFDEVRALSTITVKGVTAREYACTFTSKSWATGSGEVKWTSGKDGYQLRQNQGVQVTTNYTGANAVTDSIYTNVSKVVVTYCTNASSGAGTIDIQVGSGAVKSQSVTKTGGTTLRTLEYTCSPAETGTVRLAVNCTGNSIYVRGVSITAEREGSGSGGQKAAASVSTDAAAGISKTKATMTGSCSGASSTPSETGFLYGTSASSLDSQIIATGTTSFSATLTGLSPNTQYYYQSYATVAGTGEYSTDIQTFKGSVESFTTLKDNPTAREGWMELPAKAVGSNQYYGECSVNGVRNYSYLYDKTRYAALWVAYPLCLSNTSGEGHSSGWRWNPDIEQQYQINVKDKAYGVNYGNSTYARGHQIPNADRKDVDEMNTQTYYLTNQTPQIQSGFNSGVWNSLEGDVRSLLSSTDTVYVITGPTYEKVGESKTINYLTATSSSILPSTVPIPNYYWKVLLKVKRSSDGSVTSACAIGVWLEHKVYSGTSWTDYVTSVDQIESFTGFDLFANLPDPIGNSAKANTSWTTFSGF